jgi:heavy metal sensor kinase
MDVTIPGTVLSRFGDGNPSQLYFALWTAEGPQPKVWTSDGMQFKSVAMAADVPDPVAPLTGFAPMGPPSQPEPPVVRQRGDLREAYVQVFGGAVVLVGRSIAADKAELRRSAWLLGLSGVGVLLFGLAGGWYLSVRAVRPIRAITAVAQEISASNLSRRIDQAGTSSELGTLARVLNQTFSRLEAAFSQQVRFTADASHELRTPLTVMHTNVQLALARERSAEEYRIMFQSCQRASERMKSLLDSLLLLARADAGSLVFTPAVSNLKRIVEDSVSMLMPLAATKNITVESHLEPVSLKADASRLGQVVTNLLTNAIRYNHDKGSIIITLKAEGAQAVLSIADTGIGIPPENQPFLFERFYRVDFSRARDDGGTGLGLAICKTIVEAHHGTITFTSEPGKGSTFTVRLPR